MIFTETSLQGAYLIDLEKHSDDRGFFARTFCEREFAACGLATRFVQASDSFNALKGTLRGMHFQVAPKAETKLVRCIAGAIYDVIIDLRPESPTRGRCFGADLTAENHRLLYVPKGFAHGFVTLADDTVVFYLIDEFYSPEHARGLRWNDPQFDIPWPIHPTIMAQKDRDYPDFDATWNRNIEPGHAR
jgi:dTDP-4-dehydrorhamnose 3,5-epimerase